MRSTARIILLGVVLALATRAIPTADAIAREQEGTVTVNIGINYGTDPVEWHNDTAVPFGESLLNATMRVANVEASIYPGLGAFVTGINGVNQNPAANLYWTFWVYNPQTHKYEFPPVGASAYLLTSDQTIQWYYSSGILGPGTAVSLNARLDTSTEPPTAIISGSIRPSPGSPINVTLEYSSDQGASYQQMARVTSSADGSFTYSWRLPATGMFQVRADAQGVKSAPVSVGTTSDVLALVAESLLIGVALGLLIVVLVRRRRRRSRDRRA